MQCLKCKKNILDDSIYCSFCGKKQVAQERKRRTRPNGTGTAYKRGNTWMAAVVVGWETPDAESDAEQGLTTLRKPPKAIKRRKGGFKTKKEALEYCAILKGMPMSVKMQDVTFQKLYEQFIKRHAERVGKDTLNNYKAAYKRYSQIYGMKFADITTEDMQNCIKECPLGKSSLEKMKALGTLMFDYAIELKIVTVNYAKYIWIPNLATESYNPLPVDVRDKMLEKGLAGDDQAALIACACYLGFRPSAFVAIKKSDYDPKEKTVKGGIKTEAGMDRIVPISSKIQPLIDRFMKSESEFLFSDRKKPYNERTYREDCFYPCLDKYGIQPIPKPGEKPFYTPYSCRHTFATSLKKINGSQKDKAALMGHTSYEMTLHYQHEDIQSLKDIIAEL